MKAGIELALGAEVFEEMDELRIKKVRLDFLGSSPAEVMRLESNISATELHTVLQQFLEAKATLDDEPTVQREAYGR